ncbi:transcriptional regulatory protein [Pseudonocardia sp. Ae168_Ps1]|uniref:tetratricopeptide repeat protein n=1 Tax=unclassified Pseudonocardia TaxID=2619320 RepID=UPI00094B19A0|nr:MULTISPECIES: LuxR family transcriptional regulator [unclassified Pseudonocardia]OLL71680.1 transcriptional regulatory protein [Pseudonocardia sp. Ae150A_Ps1]OLL77655.1 transcriptional regulatory protein [Pseudonocardia sp. Ae168_Ps1]OLL88221.1 transcriptional regulatory protein [Pseudonocardia sp. Ae263_Ps1]OLL91748.1 transcriptional regulatory protein [Pseudonocardia sp. Ae356_Ps1]
MSDATDLRERLVGRGTESDRLASAGTGAAAGTHTARLLVGPPGIGKSALLDAFCAGVPAGVRTARARGRERTSDISFAVVRDLFRDLVPGDATEDPDLFEGGARWSVSALDEGSAGAEPDNLYPVLHGLYWLTANLTARSPLVLVVDDLQWCDDASLAFVGFLLRRSVGLPLGVVLASRTDGAGALPERLAEVGAQVGAALTEVRPLDRSGVGRLAAARSGGGAGGAGGTVPELPQAPLLDALTEASGGNPLLVEQLVAELGPATGEGATDRVHRLGREVIDSLVERHVFDAPPHVRAVASAVAVVGAEQTAVLATLSGVPAGSVVEAVGTLARTEVFAPDRSDFRHDLLRSAVLRGLPGDELDDLRRRGARVLSDAGRPAEVVAAVLLVLPGAGEPWMIDVLLEAADAAAHRGARPAVARYLEPVVAARPGDIGVRTRLAAALGQNEPERAVAHLRDALDRAADLPSRAQVAVQLAMTSLAVQQAPRAVRVLEDVLDTMDRELPSDPGPGATELRTHVEAALLVVGLDEKKTVAATIDRMGRMATPAGRTPAERQKLAMMTVTRAMDGEDAPATVDLARRVLLVDEATLGGWAVLASSLVLRLADEVDESTAVLDRLVAQSREQASAWTYSLAVGTRATNHVVVGDLAEGEADARTALDIAEQEAWRGNTVVPRIALANVRHLQGDPEAALALLDGIVRPRLEDFAWEYHDYLMARAGATADTGDTDWALATYRRCGDSLEAAGIANPVLAPWWLHAAVLLAGSGRAHEAHGIVERGADRARRWGTARGRGLALVARGVVTPGRGGTDLLGEAVAVLEGSPARTELILAHHLLGRAMLDAEYPEAAREELRQAATLAARCGALRAATAARELLVQAGGRMRPPTGSPLDPLTSAERRVVALAAEGARNREIAEALFVTLRTVEVHLTSAFRKLGVPDRAALAGIVGAARTRLG